MIGGRGGRIVAGLSTLLTRKLAYGGYDIVIRHGVRFHPPRVQDEMLRD